jgi:hypothetical protein
VSCEKGVRVTVPDFSRSFVTFFASATQGNNIARIQIDATCTITRDGHLAETYCLIAPCRSEMMYRDGPLFQMPNYEFCGIFTQHEVALIRTHWTSEHEQREYARVSDRFDRVDIHISDLAAEQIESPASIVDATLANRRIVTRTTIDLDDGAVATLDYPVKTMNVTRDPLRWQIDTGPVIVPGPATGAGHDIGRFDIAYVASCDPGKAEWILRRPHPVGPGIAVTDYSEIVIGQARHAFWAEV